MSRLTLAVKLAIHAVCRYATRLARFEGVPPGESDLALVETAGTAKLWTFRRPVTAKRDDRRVEFVAKDGDATLVVFVACPGPLPEGTGIMLVHKGGSRWARVAMSKLERGR